MRSLAWAAQASRTVSRCGSRVTRGAFFWLVFLGFSQLSKIIETVFLVMMMMMMIIPLSSDHILLGCNDLGTL